MSTPNSHIVGIAARGSRRTPRCRAPIACVRAQPHAGRAHRAAQARQDQPPPRWSSPSRPGPLTLVEPVETSTPRWSSPSRPAPHALDRPRTPPPVVLGPRAARKARQRRAQDPRRLHGPIGAGSRVSVRRSRLSARRTARAARLDRAPVRSTDWPRWGPIVIPFTRSGPDSPAWGVRRWSRRDGACGTRIRARSSRYSPAAPHAGRASQDSPTPVEPAPRWSS